MGEALWVEPGMERRLAVEQVIFAPFARVTRRP